MNILVPISIGELYDKISILNIKLNHIKDKEKISNIQKEKFLLEKIAIDMKFHIDNNSLYIDLLNINNLIWDIEDKIRIKEKNKIYDDEFIQLARSVYFNNDKRAEIKKQINLIWESNIIEEKSYQKYK